MNVLALGVPTLRCIHRERVAKVVDPWAFAHLCACGLRLSFSTSVNVVLTCVRRRRLPVPIMFGLGFSGACGIDVESDDGSLLAEIRR